MLYLLVVIVTAVQFGRMAAVLTSILSFLAIDFFFVPPVYSLTATNPTEWLALCVFLCVATVTGQLTAMVRARAQEALEHDRDMTALAEASWETASEIDCKRALDLLLRKIGELLNVTAAGVITQDVNNKSFFTVVAQFGSVDREAQSVLSDGEKEALDFVFSNALPLGPLAQQFPNPGSGRQAYEAYGHITTGGQLDLTFLPIYMEGNVAAVLYLKNRPEPLLTGREQHIMSALVNHVGLVLQREKSLRTEAKAQALLEADQMKTALLSMVSHDFRSPLTSIKASIQTLKSEGGELAVSDREELLQTVDQEVDRLNRMVKNILDLSRLEAGAWRPKREEIPVSDLIGTVLGSFNEKDNTRIVVHNEAGSNTAWLDAVQIGQVLHNLIENALKYSPVDENVELGIRPFAGNIALTVADRGKGIGRDEQAKIFQPFYRGRSLSESNVPGVGIGLAVCRGLVTAHGGTIKAESREGGGTILCVTLPDKRGDAQSLEPSKS